MLGLFLFTCTACIADDAPPSAKQTEVLIDEYFTAERPRRLEIEAQLDLLPPLGAKDVAGWKDRLLKRAKKGKKAPTGATSFLYEGDRGKYIFDDSKAPVLVVALHGGGQGEGSADSSKGAFGGTVSKTGAIGVYPEVLRKTEHGWGEDDTERFVIELIEALKRTKKIDTNRVYLTGHSMGGYGTYTIGARHADVFAGLAAFAGAPSPYFDERQKDQKVVYDIEDGILPNLRNVPLFFYQSLDDPRVTPEVNLFVKDALPKLQQLYGGYEHRCEIVDKRGHDFPQKGPFPGLDWAMSHERDPRPKRILWQPVRPWKRMFYWLWWEDPTIGAELDVEVKDGNQITITTELKDLKKMSVFVDERLVDVSKDVDVRVNGTLRRRELPEARLSTLLRTIAERNDPDLAFARRIDLQ